MQSQSIAIEVDREFGDAQRNEGDARFHGLVFVKVGGEGQSSSGNEWRFRAIDRRKKKAASALTISLMLTLMIIMVVLVESR